MSRIQDRLENDPIYYSKVCYKCEVGQLENNAMSWIKDLFSKHGECIPNKDTIHIPDNFLR